jgi:hypothetical protein
MKAAPEELISIFAPEDLRIVVTGGETQAAFKMISGRYLGRGPGTDNKTKPTVVIDHWR